jgi:hypothetical protein
MNKCLLVAAALWLRLFCPALAVGSDSKVVNGGFEAGLTAWHTIGDVTWETNRPLDGKASVRERVPKAKISFSWH